MRSRVVRKRKGRCHCTRETRGLQTSISGSFAAGVGWFSQWWCADVSTSPQSRAVTAHGVGNGPAGNEPRPTCVGLACIPGGSLAWDDRRPEGMMPVLRIATASARRAVQLADWPAAPRACALEQTPLIRDAVSASECPRWDPEDGKELREKAWSPRNAPSTVARAQRVPFASRKNRAPIGGRATAVGALRGARWPRAAGCGRAPAWRGRRTGRCCGTRSGRSVRTSDTHSRRTTCARG